MEDAVKLLLSLFAMIAAYVAGIGIARLPGYRELGQRPGRDVALDGLRGYLALGVFLHHLSVTYTWKVTGFWAGSPEVYFLNSGKVGVFIFFMITGYLFVGKLLRARDGKISWMRLYESRAFRIVPLYLFAMLVVSIIVFVNSAWELRVPMAQLAVDYFKWGVFHGSEINGFADTKRIIAEVDWTLKYEWMFYLLLPLVALGLKYRSGGGILFAMSLVLYFAPIQVVQFSSTYLLLFALGGAVAWLRSHFTQWQAAAQSSTATWLALVAITAALFYPNTMDIWHIGMITFFFVLVALGNDMFGLFSRPASIVLGEISYSIYLLHGLVLYILFTGFEPLVFETLTFEQFLLFAPLLAATVVGVSTLTNLFIERPCMHIGYQYHVSGWLKRRIGGTRMRVVDNTAEKLLPGTHGP